MKEQAQRQGASQLHDRRTGCVKEQWNLSPRPAWDSQVLNAALKSKVNVMVGQYAI